MSVGYYLGYGHGFESAMDSVDDNGGVSSRDSGIRGMVLIGPTCPVVQNPPEDSCNDRPYQARLAVTTPDGSRVISEFSSDMDGIFNIPLLPGEYAVRSAVATNVLPYCSSRDAIIVGPTGYTETTIYCDSGIR